MRWKAHARKTPILRPDRQHLGWCSEAKPPFSHCHIRILAWPAWHGTTEAGGCVAHRLRFGALAEAC